MLSELTPDLDLLDSMRPFSREKAKSTPTVVIDLLLESSSETTNSGDLSPRLVKQLELLDLEGIVDRIPRLRL